ncbi:MAG: hypothetical protein ACYTEX_11030 [Planctomycetota bacterium]|jgi:hypothetical protein
MGEKGCPKCGQVGNGYRVTDWGCAIVYVGDWGAGRESEEMTEVKHTRPVPSKARCVECNALVPIDVARGAHFEAEGTGGGE